MAPAGARAAMAINTQRNSPAIVALPPHTFAALSERNYLSAHKKGGTVACYCSLTARASRQVLGEGDDQASAHGVD
jgi:hypothetical protein